MISPSHRYDDTAPRDVRPAAAPQVGCDRSAEIITRFDGYRGRYLFHCHNAEHEDMGMMANLEII
ncbi:multicopper oxidase domain-containing protein [Actinoallomurus sp. CA-150999]|uniref:multicopper oxidase domain-containing protein n=1 Tax=Actinoallomurus sp. CA-150999 TaxID=3239887 RepID=UPI003D922150